MDDKDIRKDLARMRDEELAKLAALASDQDAAQNILRRLHSLEEAISKFSHADDGRYAKHNSAIEAILVCLDEVGHPIPSEQIIKSLCGGGWRGGTDTADAILRKSIGSLVSGRGAITKQIKKVNGLIGRGEWPDSVFYSALFSGSLSESPAASSKFARCKTAVDAILAYLTESGRPALPQEIATAISEGGWRGGGEAARIKVLQSIGQLRSGTKGATTGKVRFVKDLVGLGEWESSMF